MLLRKQKTPVPHKKTKPACDAFSLVEMIIAMFIFSFLALAFTKGLTFARYTAEDNLYDATALTVGISSIEQMKGASLNLLENPPRQGSKEIFEMAVEGGKTQTLCLEEANALPVPIVTENGGAISKYLDLEITPSIEKMDNDHGYWLSVQYSYKHPRTGRQRTATIRNALSTVQSL